MRSPEGFAHGALSDEVDLIASTHELISLQSATVRPMLGSLHSVAEASGLGASRERADHNSGAPTSLTSATEGIGLEEADYRRLDATRVTTGPLVSPNR